ncbi:hypothetical protein EDD16DRAFT_1547033 [Pisolithus croceorrhizus]|nr:hypothetical protein EDD16DRAFT_1547033 [Pisolithus croceorrhizus]KAI6133960.1 hypothetical protein EV401DRAFT_1910766 [Pisolithus croceorrhizus]KAI6162910.1 hypothetical protein EDD17DRAFT_1573484 [Pisolithus thermaeus]
MTSADSLQDTYARLLVHAEPERGYPLWFPEPGTRLPPTYLHEGVRIGDVGIVTPDGNFNVFFNICLPGNHPLHHRYGVPDGFRQVALSEKDVEIVEDPKYRGCMVTTQCSPKRNIHIKVTGANPNVVTVKGNEARSVAKAAILALPSGVDKHDLLDTSVFQKEAIRMGKAWYEFALKSLGRTTVGHDSLYLITGYHKAPTWSLAAFHNPSAIWTVDVQYTGNGDVMVTDPWGRVGVSPSPIRFDGRKDHTIAVRGFKIAIREKTFRSLLPSCTGKGFLSQIVPPSLHYRPPMSKGRFHKLYHPLDGINSMLLEQARHCDTVVTHDDIWKDIVHELPSNCRRLRDMMAVIKKKGYALSSNAGCAYLTKRKADNPGCTVPRVKPEVADLAFIVREKERKQLEHTDTEKNEDVGEQKNEEKVEEQKDEKPGEQKDEEVVGEQQDGEELGKQRYKEEVGEQEKEEGLGEEQNEGETGKQKNEEETGEYGAGEEAGESEKENADHENVDTNEDSSDADVSITPM